MNLTPEEEESINSTMNCLRTNDKTIILGMVDIVDIWPSGRAYLASTTAEEVFIEFRGVRHSKTMILNLREALRGIVENNTVQTAVMKCVRTDTENDLIQELHEVNFSAEIEPSFDEIIQLLNGIETIPDEEFYSFEAKIQSCDIRNKIFSGYVEYAVKQIDEERATVFHKSYLLQ